MSSASTIPSELFGYKVVDKVGEGAASIVYAVMDPKSRQVMALKHVLRRTDKDQRFIDQLMPPLLMPFAESAGADTLFPT